MAIGTETYGHWKKDKTAPVAAQFRPVVAFLGYDPTPGRAGVSGRLCKGDPWVT